MPQKQPETVAQSEPRTEARVTFEDGSVYGAPIGTRLEDYFVAARRELIPCARRSGDIPGRC